MRHRNAARLREAGADGRGVRQASDLPAWLGVAVRRVHAIPPWRRSPERDRHLAGCLAGGRSGGSGLGGPRLGPDDLGGMFIHDLSHRLVDCLDNPLRLDGALVMLGTGVMMMGPAAVHTSMSMAVTTAVGLRKGDRCQQTGEEHSSLHDDDKIGVMTVDSAEE